MCFALRCLCGWNPCKTWKLHRKWGFIYKAAKYVSISSLLWFTFQTSKWHLNNNLHACRGSVSFQPRSQQKAQIVTDWRIQCSFPHSVWYRCVCQMVAYNCTIAVLSCTQKWSCNYNSACVTGVLSLSHQTCPRRESIYWRMFNSAKVGAIYLLQLVAKAPFSGPPLTSHKKNKSKGPCWCTLG